jgi:hypothetical protein
LSAAGLDALVALHRVDGRHCPASTLKVATIGKNEKRG